MEIINRRTITNEMKNKALTSLYSFKNSNYHHYLFNGFQTLLTIFFLEHFWVYSNIWIFTVHRLCIDISLHRSAHAKHTQNFKWEEIKLIKIQYPHYLPVNCLGYLNWGSLVEHHPQLRTLPSLNLAGVASFPGGFC